MRLVVVVLAVAGCGRIGFGERSGSGDGSLVGDARPDVMLPAGVNVAFITSTKTPAFMIGGLAGGDAICSNSAAAAGWPGTFVAWLSTSTVDARDRLGSARGWYRADGKPLADTIDDMLAQRMFYPLSVDEFGNDRRGEIDPVFDSPVAVTGTGANGRVISTQCGNWDTNGGFVTGGITTSLSNFWTGGTSEFCSAAAHVYCFGIDSATPVIPTPQAGRRAFVLEPWAPGGGLAGADANCQSAASTAGLTGSYRAFLTTSTASAASRFDPAGPNWVRVDGIPLGADNAQVLAGNFDTAIQLRADGTPVPNTTRAVFTGEDSKFCADWTTVAPGQDGGVGFNDENGPRAVNFLPFMCSRVLSLYCFEQ